jgi:hypothetical protein
MTVKSHHLVARPSLTPDRLARWIGLFQQPHSLEEVEAKGLVKEYFA